MSRMLVFGLLIVSSTLVSVGYLIWGLGLGKLFPGKKKHTVEETGRDTYILKGIVMLLCPVIGPCYFLVTQLLYLVLFRQDVDLEDVVFSKERVESYVRADEERERNMVPLEEAIAVSDKSSLRTLMLNVIRGDIQNSLSSIALALNSKDSETSHYAASVLQDELNNFRVNVQKMYTEMEQEDENQTDYELFLISYMNSVLKQKIFTEMEQENFVHILANAGESLFQKDKRALTSEYYEWICLRLLDIRDFAGMEKWCDRGFAQYPDALSAYTCRLKLYFTTGQREKFFQVLEQLKNSSIVIDKETLELIRIFS